MVMLSAAALSMKRARFLQFEMATNATSTTENVNSLLGLSRNDHTAMLDVLHDYFNTHNEVIFKYQVIHACFSAGKP